MRLLLALVTFVTTLGWSNADDVTAKSLEGKWLVVSVTRDGLADDSLKGAIRTHDAGTYTIKPASGSKAPAVSGAMTVSAGKNSAEIAMKPAEGRYKDKTLLGIAKLEGDVLTIAFAEPGKDRPATFESTAGSSVVVAVHKRVE